MRQRSSSLRIYAIAVRLLVIRRTDLYTEKMSVYRRILEFATSNVGLLVSQ